MDVVIHVEGLAKRYKLGAVGGGELFQYRTLRDTLAGWVRGSLRRFRASGDGHPAAGNNLIWALNDISFDVRSGEVVGVIGRNGAGKSTLLKILSRITEPTRGRATVQGRIGTLLEVGTGFHPELTGRENVYLNGAVLGMGRAEIERKFDEIVDFSGVHKFMDTPVKFYSSGMYVRLAFSVAVHLQPDILLVDEVLAVGDIEFQKKCIGKMESVASQGKTVLLVSHSMSSIKALCTRALLLDSGRLRADGSADEVVAEYLSSGRVDQAEKILRPEDHSGGVRKIQAERVRLVNGVAGQFSVYWKQPISIALDIQVLEPIDKVAFGAGIRGLDGSHVFTVHHDDHHAQPLWDFPAGRYSIEFHLDNPLRPGLYKVHIGADQEHLWLRGLFGLDDITLEVLDHAEDGAVPERTNTGILNGQSTWTVHPLGAAS